MRAPRVLVLAALSLLLIRHEASSCSCGVSPTATPTLVLAQYADAVFSACVVSIVPIDGACQLVGSYCVPVGPQSAVILKLSASWKGPRDSLLILLRNADSCAYQFQEGLEYLVFAYSSPDGLTTSVRSATRPLPSASGLVSDLGMAEVIF